MTVPPLAAVAAVCTLACVVFTYRRSCGGAGGSGGASRSRWTSVGTGGDARSDRVLAVVMTLLVVLSMVATPVAAGLESATGVRAASTGQSVDGGVSANHDAPGTNDSTGDGTTESTTGSDAAGESTGTWSTDGGTVVATDRGNTGFQPWYLYIEGVNTANGNLFRSDEDVSIRARGMNLTFVRSYNSHASAEHGVLGFGWTHSYAMRLEERADGSVVFVDRDGSTHTFAPTDGGYEAPPGVHARLRANGSGFDLDRLSGHTLHFDADGVLQWIADRNGNRVHLEYTDGRLVTVRDDSGQRLELRYTEEGRIANVTDPLNRTVEYEYETGDLVRVTGPAGDTTGYDYYENHKLRTIEDPFGATTRYGYHEDSDRVRCADSGETSTPCTTTGAAFGYDYANDTVDVRRVLSGESVSIGLNDAGNPTSIESASTTKTARWDDEMNRIELTNETGTYTYEYDAHGNLLEWTGPAGRTLAETWRTIATEDTYVSVRTGRTTPRGFTTEYRYDEDGNLVAVTNAVGETRRLEYDAHGNVVATTDFAGHETTYTYETHGFRTSVTDPTGATTNFSYDAIGRMVARTDPRGNTARLSYNARGDVVAVTDPNGNAVEYRYDDSGSLTGLERPTGPDGTRSVVPPRPGTGVGPDYELQVDEDDSFTVRRTRGDRAFVLRYDARELLQSRTVDYGPFERTVDYSYDADGNPVRIETPGGTVQREFDGLGRVTRIEGPDGSWVAYTYGAAGRPTRVNYSSGVSVSYTYDDAGRMLGIRTVDANSSVLFERSYTYDADGNRLTSTDADGNVTRYSYDELNRLVGVSYPSGRTINYTYDAVGNRLTRTVNGTDTTRYEYDDDGRLVRAGDTTYEYAANGSLIAETDDAGRTEYTYGPGDRLASVDLPDGDWVSFSYLPTGERLSKTTPDGTTYYLYSQFHLVGTFDENGTLERQYLQGPGVDRPAGVLLDGELHAYQQDSRNSVRLVTDGNGSVANRYRYTPYGELRSGTETVPNPYRFAGRHHDAEIDLYYNRMRYYDPATGRFTRQDPAGVQAGPNLYRYAKANPVRFGDPFGLDADRWDCGGWSQGGMVVAGGFESFTGECRNKRTGQTCEMTKYCGKVGLGLGGSVSASGGVTSGPECGRDLLGNSVDFGGCGSVGGVLGLSGCVGTGGVSGGGTVGVGIDLEVRFTFCQIASKDLDCECVDECKENGKCDDEPPDDPPGNDHPDDNHDPSVLSFDRTVERSSVPAYDGYTPDVAVLDQGFDEELGAFLASVDESRYATVEVGVTEERLGRYDVLIVPTGGLMGLASFDPFERKLDRFVESGGTLLVMPQQRGYQFEPVPGELRGYGWVEDQSCQFRSVGIDEYCPIVASQGDDVADINVDGYFTEYPEDAEIILTRAKNGRPSMLRYDHGNGTVIATTAYTDWAWGHNAWNKDGSDVLRDAITLARGTRNLTTYAPGENATLSVGVDSYVDLRADRMEVRLYRPQPAFECRRSLDDSPTRCFDFNRKRVPPLTVNVSGRVSPLATRDVSVDLSMPPERTVASPGYVVSLPTDRSQTGVWDVGYSLYNESHGEIQRVRRTEQFALSTFEPSPGGYQRFDSNVKLSVTSDAEHYARGSNATFTITARNEGDENETVTLWWAFPHNHRRPEDDALYGASTTRPADRNSALNRTLAIPAGGERTVTYEVPVTSFDRLWLQAHRGTNQSGEYLGRTSRGFFVFGPSVDANVSTDRDRYSVGANATIDTELRGRGVESATVETVVLAPDNTLVDRHTERVTVGSNRTTLARTVGLPTTPKTGHYVVTTEVLDADGGRIGYDSTTFEVPYEVRVTPTLPATVRETTRVELAVENLGDSTVRNASLDAALVDPSGATLWNGSARVDVAGEDTTRVDFEDVPVGESQFGTYELRYALEFGSNRLVRTRRLPSSVLVTGGFTEPRYRQRENATATVSLRNDGRFPIDENVTVEVPDAGFVGSRPLAFDSGERANRSYDVGLPADIPAGTHEAIVTVGSRNPTTRTFEFVVPESDLRVGVERGELAPGEDATVTVRNVGGVDTDADCSVELVDPQGLDVSTDDLLETIRAGENATRILTVPDQAISGTYFVVGSCTDGTTGERTDRTETVEVDGLSAGLNLSTDAEVYGPDENVTVAVDISNREAAVRNGTVRLTITDPSAAAGSSGAGSSVSSSTNGGTRVGASSAASTDSVDTAPAPGSGTAPAPGSGTAPASDSGTDTASAPGSGDGSLEAGDRPGGVSADTERPEEDTRGVSTSGRLAGERRSSLEGPGAGASGGFGPVVAATPDAAGRTTDESLTTAIGIDGTTVWKDRTVTVNESVVVNASANLTLVNATLRFEGMEYDVDRGIEVRDGGELRIRANSTVESVGWRSYYFRARPGSTLELRNATVRDVGESSGPLEDRGPYVATDDATVRNVTFGDTGDGLVLHGTTGLTVADSRFTESFDHAIHLHDARDTLVTGNDVTRGSVLLRNTSDSTVRDNDLDDVNGIQLRGGSDRNVVADNDLSEASLDRYSYDAGIAVSKNANYTTVSGNELTGTEGDAAIVVRGNHTVVRGNIVDESVEDGIRVTARNATLENNTVGNSEDFGLILLGAENATLRDNAVDSFRVDGRDFAWLRYPQQVPALRYFEHDIDTSNTVGGRQLRYLFGASDTTVENDGDAVWLAGATNVTVHGEGPVSVARSTDVTVRDLRVRDERYGVLAFHANGTTVSNVTARRNEFGLLLAGAQHEAESRGHTVEASTFTNNTEDGVHAYFVADTVIRDSVLADNEGNGLHLSGRNLTVSGNEVTGGQEAYRTTEAGILADLSNSTVSGNAIHEVPGTGIYVTETVDAGGNDTVSDNEVTAAGTGIDVLAADSVVAGNEIRNGEYSGITVSGDNVTVRGNRVAGHSNGIAGEGAADFDVRQNVLYDNEIGIEITGYFGCCVRSANLTDNRGGNNSDTGILLRDGREPVLRNNSVAGTWADIRLVRTRGATLRENALPRGGLWVGSDYRHDIDTSNTVRGKPIHYLVDARDVAVPAGAGDVWLVNATNATVRESGGATLVDSENATVRNVTTSNRTYGVYLLRTTNSTVRNVTVVDSPVIDRSGGMGVRLEDSRHNRLEDVTVLRSDREGVRLDDTSENNTLRNALARSNGEYRSGVSVEGDNNTLRNVTAVNNSDGVSVGGSNNTLRDVTAENSSGHGIYVPGTDNRLSSVVATGNANDGVSLSGRGVDNTLGDATVRHNGRAGVSMGSGNAVSDVLAVDNRKGVDVYGDDHVLENITARSNEYGFHVGDQRNVSLRNVTAVNGSVGVYSLDSRNLTVVDSRLVGNDEYGIELRRVENGTYRGNVFRGNGWSVFIGGEYAESGASSGNLFYDNYFESGVFRDDRKAENNSWNVTKRPANDTNVIGGPFLGGNFWGGYDGRDTDEDGLGDTNTPYDADGQLQVGDHHPLVQPADRGALLWERNVSVDVAAGTTDTLTLEVPADELAGSGKRKLSGTLNSASGQVVAVEDPSFYVFESTTTLTLEPDEPIYRTGETATVSGVLTNDGSAERTYDLSVSRNGTEIHGESVTLAPGENHSYTVNTTADGPFRLTASAGNVSVGELVEVADPQVETTVSAPLRVDRGPFGVTVRLNNTGRIRADLAVALTPGNDTWEVTLAPGETRLLRANRSVRADAIYTVDVSGDVDRSLTEGVAFAENATVATSPADVYTPGTVEVPYTVENTDALPTELTATFAVGSRTRQRTVYLPTGGTTAGSVVFDLPAGTHTLAVDWPFGNATRTLTVAEPDQLAVNATVPATPTNGTLRTTVELENVGPNAVNGTLRADSPVTTASRGFDLAAGQSDTLTLTLDVPEGTTPGRYDLTVSAETGGDVLAEETATFETAGPVFELVSGPDLGTYGLGEEVRVNATVANTGTAGGQVALNATAPGIAETSETAWLGAGERARMTTTVQLPDDLEAGSYDLFYGLDGADRRTSIAVAGAKVDVAASLDQPDYTANQTANLTLTVTNERDIDLSPFVRVKFNGNETVRSVDLNGSETETLSFRVPIRFDGDEKIFYGVYADTGRSLYISGVYPHRARPNVTVSTDRQIYEPGDTATVTVSTDREGEVMLSAPGGFGRQLTLDGTTSASFEVPPLGSGTYYLHYSFANRSYSYPFDVDGYGVQVRDANLDQGVYRPGDTVGLSLELVPTRNVSGSVTATLRDTNGTAVATERTAVGLETGRSEVTLAPTLPGSADGSYLLRYHIDASVDSRAVIDTQGVKYLEVEGGEPNATNRAPVPVVAVSPTDPTAGERVTFDASASYDADGTVTRYQWDLDDDGVYDGTGTRITHTFATAGDHPVTLRVTDDRGATNTTTRTVEVAAPTATPTPSPGAGDGGDGGGGGGQPGAAPGGDVELTGATLPSDSVTAGQLLTVRVDLANFDPVDGRLTLRLTANGSTVTERTVTVGASSERTVSIEHAFGTAGTYELAVNGEPAGTVTVIEAATPTPTATRVPTDAGTPTSTATRAPTPTATATDTTAATDSPTPPSPSTPTSGDGPGFGALAALLALLALIGRRRLRRRN